jgi:hypothetical protein
MATRYWVGGTGTWDASSTTNWSATTGGAGGASAPVALDSVIFDSASGTGTCTTAAGAVCTNATLSSATLLLTLGADITVSTRFTLTNGTLSFTGNSGNWTLTTGVFDSLISNVRLMAFGTGKINLTGLNTTIFNFTNTNCTFTGTPVVNCTYSGSTGTRLVQGGLGYISFNVTAGTDIFSLGGSNGYYNVDFTGFSGTLANSGTFIGGDLKISTGMTLAAGANSITFQNFVGATGRTQQVTTNGKTFDFPVTVTNVGNTVQLQDNLTMGSTRTFTLTSGDLHINNRTLSTGLFNSNNTNTRTIDFKSGNITVTGNSAVVWNTTTATNLSVLGTPVVNCTYAGSTGTRVLAVNRTTLNGIESKAINFYINAGTDSIVTGAANDSFKTLSFTGFSGSFTFNATTVYQDLILSSGMTLNSSATGVNFSGNTTQLVTTAGKTLDFPITFGSASSTPTVIFQDALTQGSTKAFTITKGTVQLKASATSTTGVFATTGTTQKYLQSTTPGTQATLTQASGTVDATYLSIKDIVATGGATWNALWSNNNVDEGNNSGWVFGDPPIISAVEYTYALKSFTQPRRF